ncbi:hypothetical protein [Streptomyces sp. NRRL B-24484]|uniref:hypothetical protein n=1 Tax=Streptomyces sp. NRRL B-24484 TaxID=1463833 RepID=UPI0005BA0512|nr:hypothetical protein [Streptomyces sp. NRRL B-24484]
MGHLGLAGPLMSATAFPHRATITRQLKAGTPEDGWATWEDTRRACLVCNCGTVTGWQPVEEIVRLAQEHTEPRASGPRPPHNASIIQQYQASPNGHLGWGHDTRTGRACLACNCGTITGWLPLAEIMAIAEQHRIEL